MAGDAERFVRLARLGRESLAQDRPDTAVPTLEDAGVCGPVCGARREPLFNSG